VKFSIVFVCLFLSVNSGVHANINTNWEKIKERNGVTVFKGEVVNSPIVAFRGSTTIDANIVKVVSVLRDDAKKPEWISDLAETEVILQKNILQKLEYNRTKAPWPLQDRDFIYNADVKINKEKGEVEVSISSATHADYPVRAGVVRGELTASRYFMRSVDGGKKTYIEVEILADPKGSVPKWVVNIFQSMWPSNTLSNIRRIAEDPSYTPLPEVVAFASNLNAVL
jgi:hypothetical protein